MTPHLHLASRSPRRRDLLTEAGIPFTLIDQDVDETVSENLAPGQVPLVLAERKARAGAEGVGDGWVLGADTVVVLGDRILGKPRHRDEAREMLASLSGNTHQVITGICLLEASSGAKVREAEVTRVVLRAMTPAEIRAYVDSGESDGKAGAYAIQETGDRFVERIEGSYTNVVGLPMELLDRLMRAKGLIP